MDVLLATGAVSVEEYLTNPAYQHCEYVDGEVTPLNVGTRKHAKIQSKCAFQFETYLAAHPGRR